MPFALGVAMAMVVVLAALVGTGVWAAVRLEGHMDTPATLARQGQLSKARNVRGRCRDTAHHRAGVC